MDQQKAAKPLPRSHYKSLALCRLRFPGTPD
jgi:hypothetical protein